MYGLHHILSLSLTLYDHSPTKDNTYLEPQNQLISGELIYGVKNSCLKGFLVSTFLQFVPPFLFDNNDIIKRTRKKC